MICDAYGWLDIKRLGQDRVAVLFPTQPASIWRRAESMNNGELCARHYATGKAIRIQWQHGRIHAVLGPNQPVPKDLWIAPALVDLQVNGFGGVDFQRDDLPLSDLVTAARRLRAAGCSRFLLTLITDEWPRLLARLRHLHALRQRSAELRHAIVGGSGY